MAKPNYKFDKRQRELKAKEKQEAKRLKKLARQAVPTDGAPAAEPPTKTEETAS